MKAQSVKYLKQCACNLSVLLLIFLLNDGARAILLRTSIIVLGTYYLPPVHVSGNSAHHPNLGGWEEIT